MDSSVSILTLVIFAAGAALWYGVTRPRNRGVSPEEERDEGFVEIFRCDMGQGYTDSHLLDIIGYLGSRGIRATYDVAYAGGEGLMMKTYSLKVSLDDLDEAREELAAWHRKESGEEPEKDDDEGH